MDAYELAVALTDFEAIAAPELDAGIELREAVMQVFCEHEKNITELSQLKLLLRLEAAKRGMIERDLPLKEWQSLPPGFLANEAIFSLEMAFPMGLSRIEGQVEADLALSKAMLAVAKWRHEKYTQSPLQVLLALTLFLGNQHIVQELRTILYHRGGMLLLVHGINIADFYQQPANDFLGVPIPPFTQE